MNGSGVRHARQVTERLEREALVRISRDAELRHKRVDR